MKKFILSALAMLVLSANVMAEAAVQDMSDPLAVFIQGGFDVTNQGLTIKISKISPPQIVFAIINKIRKPLVCLFSAHKDDLISKSAFIC